MSRVVRVSALVMVSIACVGAIGPAAADGPALTPEFSFPILSSPAGPLLPTPPRPVAGQLCHDGIWPDGEFCGRDAVLTTDHPPSSNFGVADLNHDCLSDALDFRLLGHDWTTEGPNISGDLNGDQIVGILDLIIFNGSVTHPACPCTPSGMQPDECAGLIALSFTPDPDAMIHELALPPGFATVYVIAAGYEDAAHFEISVVASDNILITDHVMVTDFDGWGIFDPDPQHSYRVGVKVGDAVFPPAPIVFSEISIFLTDSDPAWLKIEPFPFADFLADRVRWSTVPSDHSVDFETVLNVGINGPALPGVSTCGTIVDNPCEGDNLDPICDAGPLVTGTVGTPVHFDGTASSDPDGTIVSYGWDFGDDSTGTGPQPAHVYAVAATYMITLTVTDDGSASTACTTTAEIDPFEPCDRISTFDSDDEGWTEEDPEEVSVVWMASGGDPGGFLRAIDEAGGGAAILGPSKFHGDLSALDGIGVVRLDHNLIDTDGHPIVGSPRVALFGPGGAAKFDYGPPTVGEWSRHEIPLLESLWTITEGSWGDLLADVQELRLRADMTAGFDEHGFDNVYVGIPPDPEEDCNGNQIPDACETDSDGDGIPDDCEVVSVHSDPVTPPTGPVIVRLANHPNPFNPRTTIVFELTEPIDVALSIHDVSGRLVKTLIESEQRGAGSHALSWDGRNDAGQSVSTGVYQYRLRAADTEKTGRMVLLR